jgi:hypothetical protein
MLNSLNPLLNLFLRHILLTLQLILPHLLLSSWATLFSRLPFHLIPNPDSYTSLSGYTWCRGSPYC